jgi:predicted phage gp36 major capsid-like protein
VSGGIPIRLDKTGTQGDQTAIGCQRPKLGKPPAVGVGGSFPLAFGNFRRGCELIDRGNLLVRSLRTTLGFTIYVRRRVYGHVLNNNAIKFLEIAS